MIKVLLDLQKEYERVKREFEDIYKTHQDMLLASRVAKAEAQDWMNKENEALHNFGLESKEYIDIKITAVKKDKEFRELDYNSSVIYRQMLRVEEEFQKIRWEYVVESVNFFVDREEWIGKINKIKKKRNSDDKNL